MKPVSHVPDRLAVSFDDEGLATNAGLIVVATLSARLGIGRIVEATLRMAGLVGGACPGRKVLTLVHAMVAGASHIGYHPILATRADTGEIIHARMRKGSANTARGARRFIDELTSS